MEYCRDNQEHDNTGIELCGVYRDLPIEIDEFRVLSVQPASSRDSLVITDLYVEKFQDRQGNYDALSYTWGDLSSTEVIVVNGTETSVTRNLRLALQNLRHRSQDQNEPARLWVDSICINQANMTERNIQVAQMGKIYSQARHVAIWLGDASETSHVAMQLLNDCDGLSGDIDIIGRVIGDEAGGRALTELLQRRYWSRMWVFQEIVLSRSATVYCGNLSAKWDVFRRLDWISGRPSLWTGLGIRSGWVLALRRAFFGIAQFCIPREDAVDVKNVLQPTRNLHATDPRDKLYALLGVCNSVSFPPPDYSKIARDVYVDFTRSFIRQDNNLSILLTAGLWNPENGKDIGLPSWVPDFRGMQGMDVRYLAASYLGYFSASTGQQLNPEALLRDPDPNVLVADGVILDAVKKTVTLGVGEEKRNRAFKRIDPQSMGSRPAGSSQLRAFFETMIFDNITLHRGVTAKENVRRLAVGFLREINTFYHEHEVHHKMTTEDFEKLEVLQSDLFKSAVEEYQRLEVTDPEELHWRREEYTLRTEEVTNGSLTKIFSTEGDYVGRGLTSIEDGDLVAILFGCKLPVILRKYVEQPAYELISPCYVSGIMNGEAIVDLNFGDFAEGDYASVLRAERLRLV